MVRALAFGARGPRFKSWRGENYFSYTNPNFILSNRREGARQLKRRASAVRKMNAQIFGTVSCRGTEIREEGTAIREMKNPVRISSSIKWLTLDIWRDMVRKVQHADI